MGIPDVPASLLIKTVKDNDLGGVVLMLGRQNFIGRRRGKAAEDFASVLSKPLETAGDGRGHQTDYIRKWMGSAG